jgi:hypothetical protein
VFDKLLRSSLFDRLGELQNKTHRFEQAAEIVFDLSFSKKRTALRNSKNHSDGTKTDVRLGLQEAIDK